MNYRPLTTTEIDQLTLQGCTADDWTKVEVAEKFACEPIRQVKFTGRNRLGAFGKDVVLGGGISAHSGIFHTWLHNCTVGDNVFIRAIRQYIANYEIGDDAIICDCGVIETVGESAFGNGVRVNTIDETGAHSVLLYDNLSAQMAYLWTANKPRPAFDERMEHLVGDYCREIKSTIGKVAAGATITGCQTIRNVFIGAKARLENAVSLENGSILSVPEAPVYVGHGCSCSDFIIQSGASLHNGVLLSRCLIGQGGLFDKQFSAEHSLFFANCQGFHGEACSVFAGPYSVTHHKSTLLIAGLFSFMNAGSGSNQSNHAYKTGPVHYGITGRGLKLASDSYVFWPARIGAFTMVAGRHSNHPDTTDFPFSFLIEKEGKSHLLPGANFGSIGTARDAQKWPQRDRRKGAKTDFIHFDLLNPYTVGQLQKGKAKLAESKSVFGRVTIEAAAKQRGIKTYDFIESLFLLGELIKRVEKNAGLSAESDALPEWIDAAGMYVPAGLFEQLASDIASGKYNYLTEISAALETIYNSYEEHAWSWTATAFEKKYGKAPVKLSSGEISQYTDQYNELMRQYSEQLRCDAEKDKQFYSEYKMV